MLGLKSFRTAAITFAGIELANRIRKRQFSFGRGGQRENWSLTQLWDWTLEPIPSLVTPQRPSPPARPPTHQNSRIHFRSKTELYLLVMPSGSRYWRFNYRFDGKHKTLALGVHPDVSLEKASARHQVARSLLADGVDPSIQERASAVTLENPPG